MFHPLHRLVRLALLCLACAPLHALAAQSKPLLMLISIDGLKPEAVLEADRHGLKLPNLRALVRDGAYATGVRGVLPTLTYPSHMTILTGASPAHHGIFANTTFDPLNRNLQGWYWYAEDVKVPTLWDAAAAAGLVSANVYWPTSVGAHISYNLAQIWRAGTADDLKLQRAVSTPQLERELVQAAAAAAQPLPAYPGGEDESVGDDEVRAQYAIRMLTVKHPDFITVYLTGLDTEQHKSGPFSPPADAVLERIDAIIGALRAAAEKSAPGAATIAVVSDHGFARIQHDVNLYSAFLADGLFTLDDKQHIATWKAMPWPAGGCAAVMLANPADDAVREQVASLLDKLASDPENGIERIWSHEQMLADRGFPDAAFLVAFKTGYEIAYAFTGPLITAPANLGMHGYPPENAEMRSAFFLVGPEIPAGRSLGEIDMRRIAPTLARSLHAPLGGAELPPLDLR